LIKSFDYRLELSSAISVFLSWKNPKSLHLRFLYIKKKSPHTPAHLSCNPHTLDCCRADLFLQGKKTPLSKKLQIEGEDEGRGIYSMQCTELWVSTVREEIWAYKEGRGEKMWVYQEMGGEKMWAYREIGGEKKWAYREIGGEKIWAYQEIGGEKRLACWDIGGGKMVANREIGGEKMWAYQEIGGEKMWV
jgi:hypothetical protein